MGSKTKTLLIELVIHFMFIELVMGALGTKPLEALIMLDFCQSNSVFLAWRVRFKKIIQEFGKIKHFTSVFEKIIPIIRKV